MSFTRASLAAHKTISGFRPGLCSASELARTRHFRIISLLQTGGAMRILSVFAVLLILAAVAVSQEFPRAEIFGGYSYGNFQILRTRSSLNGWNGSATVNIYRWFGLTTDFGGLYGGTATETVPNSPAIGGTTTLRENEKLHTILFGPQFSYRRGKMSPFARVLIGEARITNSFSSVCNSCSGSFSLGTPIFIGVVS